MPDITPITMQVVINKRFGGYGLSRAASLAVAERKGLTLRAENDSLCVGETFLSVADLVPRNDPDLVAVVREMGEAANGPSAQLAIVNIGIEIEIENYDGKETVHVNGGEFI